MQRILQLVREINSNNNNNIFLLIIITFSFSVGGSDYQSFNEVITLPDGAIGFSYNVTILSDSVSEALEQFNARMEFVSGSPLMVIGPEATINITEDIGK